MNVIIELGPADLDRLQEGQSIGGGGIQIVARERWAPSRRDPAALLLLSAEDLTMIRTGITYRTAMAGGFAVDVRTTLR